ncbi:glycerophosphodiester phosphodiesterase [Salinisphaera dokdonensis]|uniref:glycerophosphodiester phosphodiesterase n=1 Tax=Salinisphaera dokdonensis TaxID=454598 RepID=UPI0033405C8E
MNSRVEHLLSHTAELALACWPHAKPTPDRLAAARIVAHRGERDDVNVQENTFAAFDPVVAAGVTALEFDIRYTRDDEPVVVHDADLERVFGLPDVVAETPWQTLRRRAPHLPHLGDFIARYAGRCHFMAELKTRGSARAEQRMTDSLGVLEPVREFHVLSLDMTLFEAAAALPAACHLPVAKLNLGRLHDWALTHDCAGLAGPHLLMRRRQIRALQAARPFVGAGFVSRPGVLMREIARGIEWIFTNEPLRLQRALDKARQQAAR